MSGRAMYLGIDIGTSGVKAVITNDDGTVVAQGNAALSVAHPHELWSEQDPDAWWRATGAAVLALRSHDRKKVKAIGLAGQMHGATLLGQNDRPLRDAILWNDGRSQAECVQLEAAEPDSRAITGNLAMPGFTAPKLLWIRAHEPHIFGKIHTVLLPKDYVRLCMTGDKASDMADSAGTLWLDVGARDWSDAMLDATGLGRKHMPTLFEGNAITGILRTDIATAWGMRKVPVVAGGGDNAAGAVGVGVVAEGDAFLSLGTSGVIFVATNEFRPNPNQAVHAFCHCLPGLWHQMSVHLSAASCVDWAASFTQLSVPDFFAQAEDAGGGSDSELFLPYLSGERTPHNDPHIRGAFLGLGNETNAGRLANAVLEGVAFAHADGLAALREAGTHVEALSVIGGGARSQYWGSILAAALGVKLQYREGGEVGPALGAAKLAMIAATGASVAEACAKPQLIAEIEPDAALAELLAPKLEKFRRAYAAIKMM